MERFVKLSTATAATTTTQNNFAKADHIALEINFDTNSHCTSSSDGSLLLKHLLNSLLTLEK